jgi:RHS repeat-associated protein
VRNGNSSLRGGFNLRLTGHAYDAESGLTYMKARIYDPVVGRFLSGDPSAFNGDPFKFNRYAYGNDNPYRYTDPTGNDAVVAVPTAIPELAPLFEGILAFLSSPATGVVAAVVPASTADASHDGASTPGPNPTSSGSGQSNGPTTSDSPKPVFIDPDKHPEAAGHAEDAQKAGKPTVLTVDREGKEKRRQEALKGIKTVPAKDRDEYPPAVTQEGGRGASVRHIDSSDNRGSGGSFGNQIQDVPNGGQIQIIIGPMPTSD